MIKRGLDLIDGFRIACKNLDASAGANPTCRAVFRKPSTYPTAIITPSRTVAYRESELIACDGDVSTAPAGMLGADPDLLCVCLAPE
ncbi:hypothetical protein M422DRAFT_266270 [Sphaerobolus stellatus SS14]|uniref:Uncharacterized protein n=1 Tax=Sphaerobolus stellatus (strain SS14) TaxID=990650 RepID=A0A0C9TPN3_SPHS4|nr:hypothetical protein M422DRAFT_266270 [Sphaerobolus stellatus SS14]